MKKTSEKTLPDKLSKLVVLALRDLELVEKQPETYVVDMGKWHDPNSHCTVCLAGAVMAMTLKESPKQFTTPSEYPRVVAAKLSALNFLRCGDVASAAIVCGHRDRIEVSLRGFGITPYEKSRSGFKKTMKAMANKLAKAGL